MFSEIHQIKLKEALHATLPKVYLRFWTNATFVWLSNEIFYKTQVKINKHTLKQLTGKVKIKEGCTPHLVELDAIAQYLGYTNWESFKQKKVHNATINPLQTQFAKIWGIVCILGTLLVVCVLFIRDMYSVTDLPCDFKVWPKKTTGSYPFTAWFEVDFKPCLKGQLRSVVGSDTVPIYPLQTAWKSYLKIPGALPMQLITQDKVVYDTVCIAKSVGWVAYTWNSTDFEQAFDGILPNFWKSQLYFIKPFDTPISMLTLQTIGIDTTQLFWTEYTFSSFLTDSIHKVDFEAKINNTSDLDMALCGHTIIEIQSISQKILLHFTRSGCEYWVKWQVGNTVCHGKEVAMPQVEVLKKIKQLHKIQYTLRDGAFEVFVDQKSIINKSIIMQKEPIIRLRFTFCGYGTFENVKVNSKKIY